MSPFDGGLKEGEGICFSSVLGYWLGSRFKTFETKLYMQKLIRESSKMSFQHTDSHAVFKSWVQMDLDTKRLQRRQFLSPILLKEGIE
jgi:hypothetical protein